LSREVDVVRTYLELRSPEQLHPALDATDSSVAFVHRPSIAVEAYRTLYRAVGYRWYWRDRNAWSDERLAAHLARPEISVWECLVDGESAGYFELERRDDGSVEIAYFGLIETFVGRGVGKAMLTRAAREAWRSGPTACGCTRAPSTRRARCRTTRGAGSSRTRPRATWHRSMIDVRPT